VARPGQRIATLARNTRVASTCDDAGWLQMLLRGVRDPYDESVNEGGALRCPGSLV